MSKTVTTLHPLGTETFQEVFEQLSMAVVVVDDAGAVLARNAYAGELFATAVDQPGARCCDFLGCARSTRANALVQGCITAATLKHGGPVNAMVDLAGEHLVTVAAIPLASGVMLQLRPVADSGRPDAALPPLRIATLGRLELEWRGASLGGAWIHQRSGEVLRYLICARGRRVTVEELVEAIWPGYGRAGLMSLRKSVHCLRERLEPDRPCQAPSRFIVASPGAYELDMDHVVVDADEFETQARAALATVERGLTGAAEERLERAAGLYHGDFMADDPYAECARAERDGLRALALRVLRELADLHRSAGRLPSAVAALDRAVALEPLDLVNQRELIALLLQTGHHASAARRYDTLRHRFGRAFGVGPDFALSELMPQAA